MTVVMATFGGLPASRSVVYFLRRSKLQRMAGM